VRGSCQRSGPWLGLLHRPRPVIKAAKIILLSAAALIVVLVAFFWWGVQQRYETQLHVPRVDWLPATASDISSSRITGWGNTHAYEFHIARADFEVLARERSWAVKPIDKETSIMRYVQCLPEGHPDLKNPPRASSSAGLYYEDRKRGGAGLTVLYDDPSDTAYVFTSSH